MKNLKQIPIIVMVRRIRQLLYTYPSGRYLYKVSIDGVEVGPPGTKKQYILFIRSPLYRSFVAIAHFDTKGSGHINRLPSSEELRKIIRQELKNL